MAEPWTTAAHRLFKKHNIRTVGYVPDAGLTELIKSCHADNDIKSVVMTTEERYQLIVRCVARGEGAV